MLIGLTCQRNNEPERCAISLNAQIVWINRLVLYWGSRAVARTAWSDQMALAGPKRCQQNPPQVDPREAQWSAAQSWRRTEADEAPARV